MPKIQELAKNSTYPRLRKGEELLFWILHKIMEIISSRVMFACATSPLVLSMNNFVAELIRRIYASGWFVRMENHKSTPHKNI